MSYDDEHVEGTLVDSIDDLGEPTTVGDETRHPVLRALAVLVAAGLGAGLLLLGVTSTVGGFLQSEAGLCGRVFVSCTTLTLDRVQEESKLALPEGSEVVSSSWFDGMGRYDFRAELRLPEGAASPLGGLLYARQPEPWPAEVAEALAGRADAGYFAGRGGEIETLFEALEYRDSDGRLVVQLIATRSD